MSKALLIFSDNIALQLAIDFADKLGNTYQFQIGNQELLNPNFTIDGKINSILESSIEAIEYSCIFIPFSLSKNNYVEFTGLRLACHIRLTPRFKNMSTPIVFYGYESAFEVNKLSSLGSILFSKGIYTTDRISIEDFRKQIAFVQENQLQVDTNSFTNIFIERLHIKPAGNYATHHSITNEWAIYRWAKALQLETENTQKIETSIGSNLYYKYLKCKYPITEVIDANSQIILNSGSILYIDDELDKGWDAIFKKICLNKTYNSIGSDFKGMTSEKVVSSTINEINRINPDVVILDYRLHDDDFENTNPQEISGYKILNEIKKINEGMQVIVLSATNKIWNLMELQKAGADGFILKESPELSVDSNYSKNTIANIYRTINDALAKKYLKEIYTDCEKFILTIDKMHYASDFLEALKNQLQLSYYLLSKAESKEQFAFAYVSLYMIIEIINKQFIEDIDEECYWDEVSKSYTFKAIERLTEWNKISFLYFKKWKGNDNRFIRNVHFQIQKRNGFIHNDVDILDRQSNNGNYLNHNIYKPEGYLNLFNSIKVLLSLLSNADTPHR